MSLGQGFHIIPAAQYHMDVAPQPSLSSSIAQVLLRESPLKARHSHPRLNPNYRAENDSKFDLGTCAHAVLLEQDSSKIVVIDPEQYPSKEGKAPAGWTNNAIRAARDNAYAAGKTPLLKGHYADVKAMVDVAQEFIRSSRVRDFWNAEDAKSELTCIWQEGSIWLRARLDRLSIEKRFIGDYKSTTDVSPEAFSRQILRMGYHIQDAFYRRAAKALGIESPRFVFLAQSCEEPYECTLHDCHPALQEIADAEVVRAIGIWRDCIKTGKWPSYSGEVHSAMPTSYMMQEHEQRLQEAA
jgi:hypothetical protein